MHFISGKCEHRQRHAREDGSIFICKKVGALHVLFTTVESLLLALDVAFVTCKFADILCIVWAAFILNLKQCTAGAIPNARPTLTIARSQDKPIGVSAMLGIAVVASKRMGLSGLLVGGPFPAEPHRRIGRRSVCGAGPLLQVCTSTHCTCCANAASVRLIHCPYETSHGTGRTKLIPVLHDELQLC